MSSKPPPEITLNLYLWLEDIFPLKVSKTAEEAAEMRGIRKVMDRIRREVEQQHGGEIETKHVFTPKASTRGNPATPASTA